jgi:HTH-type transcriptional repressor of NAD biosynthesis genes
VQPRFRTGLVVGKFSPLHRGHELVINRAVSECERVVLISYSKPEFSGCGIEQRKAWLEELFPAAVRTVVDDASLRQLLPRADSMCVPANDAPATDHRDFVATLLDQVARTTVDAVFTSEDYGPGLAAHLTQCFRRRERNIAPVVHVAIDLRRATVPVSGSALRRDIHAQREWLSPCVYASFVQRVCILGGESSGKSELARTLAIAAGTVHVPEYGRDLWVTRGGHLAYEDMLTIARRQVADEDVARRRANRIVFCDTSPLTTLFYSHDMFGRADPELERLARRSYDLHVLCEPDFPFVQDGTRVGEDFRLRQHAWYVDQLSRRHLPYVAARGVLDARVAQVLEALAGMPRS